ncbi:methyltransferase domain-containing protein [Kiritimatiellota bacterium B12222]|nr:methyltransferase domain-containing protein [Kiritimatiellota bacterium B12222]
MYQNEEELNPEAVSDYYGKVLQHSDDLQTDACCCDSDEISAEVKAALAQVNDEVMSRFYGCGSPLPLELAGCRVLDLGCGTGRDCYVASQLVGETGFVTGVDMTGEQLEVAQRNVSSQMKRFGYEKPNVEFLSGKIEELEALGIEDASVDVVISNCVINLSSDKAKVFAEIFRVLKPGGELYFSDVFASRRVPAALKTDPVLHGECLSGAMYEEDFRRVMTSVGCPDIRVMSRRRLSIDSPEVENKVGMIGFDSVTVRAFKLEDLEDRFEDYGQIAIYQGSLEGYPHEFPLDPDHVFERNRPVLVSGNTAAMLSQSRFAKHFKVLGNREQHFGLFYADPDYAASSGHDCGCCE